MRVLCWRTTKGLSYFCPHFLWEYYERFLRHLYVLTVELDFSEHHVDNLFKKAFCWSGHFRYSGMLYGIWSFHGDYAVKSEMISHAKMELLSNILETLSACIIKVWCDECHICLLYLYTVLSEPGVPSEHRTLSLLE